MLLRRTAVVLVIACLFMLDGATAFSPMTNPRNTFNRASGTRYTQQQTLSPTVLTHLCQSSISSDESVSADVHGSEAKSVTNSLSTTGSISDAAMWHRQRRMEMMERHGDQIRPLLESSSFPFLFILAGGNAILWILSIICGKYCNTTATLLLSVFPGSIMSLWQLQILHDVLHGAVRDTNKRPLARRVQDAILFWGSLPSIFGYYLYLKCGHLTHHSHVGDKKSATLKQLFASSKSVFEDGDMLFVAHRMKLKGGIGPSLPFSGGKSAMSVSRSGFAGWKEGAPLRNMAMFWASFCFERVLLFINDFVVALTGTNWFFPNKPRSFHRICSNYARVASVLRLCLWKFVGWRSLLFLWASELAWSLPPHPACTMFITNHGSAMTSSAKENGEAENICEPSSSTYAGRWYSILTLGTNYHVEHHDFPSVPLHQLWKLPHLIAPEFYHAKEPQANERTNQPSLWSIMRKAFSYPDWYACSDVGAGSLTLSAS